MSVQNGEKGNQDVLNAAFLSRKSDSDTIAVVGLKNAATGSDINNTQKAILQTFDAVGMTGEDDATRNDYSSNNYITNGDDRKVAIGKLDTQLDITETASSSHIANTSNPHSVTPAQVGNTTAQWNANELQGVDVSTTAPTDGQALVYNNSTSEWEPQDQSGGSGDGALNYILNGKAELNTDGWTGDTDLEFNRNTTDPMRGVADFQFNKINGTDASGQTVKYSFTIDNQDKGRVLEISFDQTVIDANYTTGDVEIEIYDVTNAVVIAVVNPEIIKDDTEFLGYFQTAIDSVNYELRFKQVTATTNNYAIYFDSIRVGPQDIQVGIPASDLQSYNASSSWTTNTTITASYAEYGEYIDVHFRVVLSGAPDVQNLRIDLPPGYNYNTTLANGVTGSVQFQDAGTREYVGVCRMQDANTIGFYHTESSNLGNISNTAPFTWGTGDFLSGNIRLPIEGKTSNTVLSSQTTNRRVAMSYQISGNLAVTAATPIAYPSKDYDTHNAFSGGQYITPEAGFFDVDLTVAQTATGGTYDIYVNGVQNVYANKGDTIDVRCDSTKTLTGDKNNWLSITQNLSGLQKIAVTEQVNVEAQLNGGAVLGAGAAVPFNGVVTYDTHNAWNGTQFVLPIDGKYQFTIGVHQVSADTYYSVWIDPGTGFQFERHIYRNPAGIDISNGTTSLTLSKGTIVEIRTVNAVTLVDDANHNISITRLR
jgi:hypothetical protein